MIYYFFFFLKKKNILWVLKSKEVYLIKLKMLTIILYRTRHQKIQKIFFKDYFTLKQMKPKPLKKLYVDKQPLN
jgi:hypothetical protein